MIPFRPSPFLLLAGMLLPLVLSCSGGSSGGNSPAGGAISVTLVDGPAPDYKEINLNIQKLEIHTSGSAGDSGWITLSEPKKIVDLLKLTQGVVETLAAGKTLDPGRYQQLRLVLGETDNTLKLANGNTVTLEVPSAQRTGVKMPLSFEVKVGTTADIWIDFDGAHSIQVKAGGGPTRYTLRPVVRAYDKIATGSVSGTLTGPSGPLAGAVVTAQTVDGSGNVSILRSTTTTANGAYALGLLPLGTTLYVVTQPVIGTVSYPAQASSALVLSAATPTLQASFTFQAPALSVGGASGSITPAASSTQSDVVLLLGGVQAGGPLVTLAIASVNGQLIDGFAGVTENFAFTYVPAGSYRVQALRSTLNLEGSTTATRSTLSPSFSVNNGAVTIQNIGF